MDESIDDAGPFTVAKVDDRIRLENSLTLITYHEECQNSRFVVDRFRHSHQSTMGEPQSKGAGHILFPEEATYLVEITQGIVRTPEGRYMTLEELFMVLGDFSIPQQVYSAYCACKRAGFVVIRPGILEHSPASPEGAVPPAVDCALPPFRVRPRVILDMFPNMGSDTNVLRTKKPELFPEGCRLQKGNEKEKSVVEKNVAIVGEQKGGKKRRDPPSIRPRAWPSLAYASKNAGDWKEYAELRRNLLGKSRYSSPLDRTHFLLYSAKEYSHAARRTGEIRPIARVAVFDFYSGRACPSHPPCREDSTRRFNDDLSSVPLLKAFVSLPRISFTKESGAPIDLRSIEQSEGAKKKQSEGTKKNKKKK
ncbi:tsen-54 [Pristionchus pacificus]|uniref:tRNA-splicing endonuclease subunit Sen54 N-terminal domain-containing protein n=1 Tax=Pristionchus pacificus TaxID=54126 RepID=A0A8R1V592_PRIPA|nr:tsen-54 [Pristionchus pacificus]